MIEAVYLFLEKSHATRERRCRGREAEQRREQSRDQSRRKTRTERRQKRKQSPSWDETRLETKKQSESKNKSNDLQTLELVRRALLYRKSVTAAVVLHVESDLHEHANGRRKRRKSSASSAAHLSSSRAWMHKARAYDNTAYILFFMPCWIASLKSKMTIFNCILKPWTSWVSWNKGCTQDLKFDREIRWQ